MKIKIQFDQALLEHMKKTYFATENNAKFEPIGDEFIQVDADENDMPDIIEELMSYSYQCAKEKYEEKAQDIYLNNEMVPLLEAALNDVSKEGTFINSIKIDDEKASENNKRIHVEPTQLSVLYSIFFKTGYKFAKLM